MTILDAVKAAHAGHRVRPKSGKRWLECKGPGHEFIFSDTKELCFITASSLTEPWTFEMGIYEVKKKVVWQWRYKGEFQKHWKVAKSLLTEREAHGYYGDTEIEKHAGPFEVMED